MPGIVIDAAGLQFGIGRQRVDIFLSGATVVEHDGGADAGGQDLRLLAHILDLLSAVEILFIHRHQHPGRQQHGGGDQGADDGGVEAVAGHGAPRGFTA